MRQKEKLAAQSEELSQQSKDILINKMTMLEQEDTLEEQEGKIADRERMIAEKDEQLENLTMKLNDVENLMDEVADIAYDKAVDAITAEVIIETQNQDIARLGSVRKWVEDPKIKRSKVERAFGIKVLDNAADFLRKGIDRIIAVVKKKFLQPEVKKQKTEEIKREARKSIYTYLEEAKAELAAKRAMQQDPLAEKKHYDMGR